MIRLNKSLLLIWAVVPAMLACPAQPPAPTQTLPPLPKVRSFSASPTSVPVGEIATLSWEVENATSVSIRKTSGEAVPLPDASLTTGTVEVHVDRSTVYVLDARGMGGNASAISSVAVTGAEAGAVLFTAVPNSLRFGEKTTLVWNAPNASQVEIRDAHDQVVPTSGENHGTVELSPSSTNTYTLRADGLERAVKVSVAPALVSFSSDVQEASPGSTINLSWHVGGADTVTLSAAGRGVLTTTTDPAQVADGSFPDVIPESLPTNGFVEYTLEAKTGGTAMQANLTVYVGADPAILAFTVPEFVKADKGFPVSWKTALADEVEVAIAGKVIYRAPTRELAHEGGVSIPGVQSETAIELRTTNLRGGATTKTVLVAPVGAPTFNSFTASTTSIAQGGQKATLSWDVTNARRVKISIQGGKVLTELTGASVETGSLDVYPNNQTVYTLDADNTAGDGVSAPPLQINVASPAKLLFSPEPVPANAQIQLTGSTTAGGGDLTAVNFTVKNAPGTGFIDISETGTLLPFGVGADDVSYPVDLPEPFLTQWGEQLAGGQRLYVNINGYAVFSDTPVFGPNAPTDPGTLAVLPFDYTTDPKSLVQWQLDGTGLQRRLIIQWTDVVLNDDHWGPLQEWATFQAQIYATGEIVYAYKKLSTVFFNPGNSGIQVQQVAGSNGTIRVSAGQLNASGYPDDGTTLRFFGQVPLPYPLISSPAKLDALVSVGNGQHIALQDGPGIVLPGQFGISEVNYNPAPGQAQWIELQNNTTQDIDLSGWYLETAVGNRVTLSASGGNKTLLPANGRLLLGPTPTAAEGATVDYSYGTGFVLPNGSGSLALGIGGAAYDSRPLTGAGTAGASLQMEYNANLKFPTNSYAMPCPSTSSYGANGQRGTPGAANTRCFKWSVAPVTGAFQSIVATGAAVSAGTPATTLVSTGNNSLNTLTVALNLTASGGHAVNIGGAMYGTAASPLRVDANGYVVLGPTYSSTGSNPTDPATSNPNGVLAIFWDDLAGNDPVTTGTSGVYWKQFDPDTVPGSGDEYTLISWENWKRFTTTATTSSLNFQIKILEATGSVEYHYGPMTSSGATYATGVEATVWLESMDGRAALPVSVNQASILPNTGYRFTYSP